MVSCNAAEVCLLQRRVISPEGGHETTGKMGLTCEGCVTTSRAHNLQEMTSREQQMRNGVNQASWKHLIRQTKDWKHATI